MVKKKIQNTLWKKAKKLIPGGNMLLSKRPELHLPGLWPAYYSKSKGCYIWCSENRKLLDMSFMGVGTNILGYNNRAVDQKVLETVRNGNMTTLNSFEEVTLAEKLIEMHSWADMAKFARSGGEANSIAIRLARAATGKDNVAICGYHGWSDWYLSANLTSKNNLNTHHLEGLEPLGVPNKLKNTVFTFEYNNYHQLENLVENKKIGVVKMEVSRNFEPKNNFLQKIRKLTKKKGIILIFDECTSGFRREFGGLHKFYKINPDMAVFGKALGNGYAISAILGKKEIMEYAQKTFISSTFWTERIGTSAALATLDEMKRINSWSKITKMGNIIKKKWLILAKKYDLNIRIIGQPSIPSFIFLSKNHLKYKTFISQEMLKNNILASNVIYISTAHLKSHFDKYFYYLDKIFEKISYCESSKNKIDKLLETKVCLTGFKRLN